MHAHSAARVLEGANGAIDPMAAYYTTTIPAAVKNTLPVSVAQAGASILTPATAATDPNETSMSLKTCSQIFERVRIIFFSFSQLDLKMSPSIAGARRPQVRVGVTGSHTPTAAASGRPDYDGYDGTFHLLTNTGKRRELLYSSKFLSYTVSSNFSLLLKFYQPC